MQEPKKYEEVEWAHIVPAGYLRNFAAGEMIVKHELQSGRARERPVKKVGTRRRAYSRTRPATGERIDDVEWALRHLENKVQVVRFAEKRFPFSELDRSVIAQFAGAQHVRVPKWKRRHEALVNELKEEVEIRGVERLSPIANEVLKGRLVEEVEAQGSDTARLVDMQRWLYAESAFFFAMHWTLIRFHRPALITCDHPVVLWPATVGARELKPGDGTGLQNVLEARYPLTARLCLLMTWRNGPDAPEIVDGNREMARNINGFTRAEAELEWFSLPGVSPPLPSERSRLLPLSTAIYRDYDLRSVEQSARRAQAIQLTRQTSRQALVPQPTFPALQAGRAT
ncbi:MAG TPA: DUF4238 domain-containing protein [Solirubrobacterales bacterium]|nr:DUF4238 domain-containing protein [Solirubrobacterales bacterium]